MVQGDDARMRGADAGAAFRPDAADDHPGMHAPTWMSTLPPPPLAPRTDPTPIVTRHHWARSVASALVFGVMGAVLYASLYILVGQEVQAAAVVVGLMVGAGLRLGGRDKGWATGVVAAVVALLALLAGAAVGQACLDAIALPAPLGTMLGEAFRDPGGAVERYLDPLAPAVVALFLCAAGALLATLTFRTRRA